MEVCKEMFDARGYIIYEESEYMLKATKPDGVRVYLLFIQQNKFNIDVIKYYYRLFLSEGIKHAILIYKDQMTPSVKKIINGIQTIRIELFKESNFYYNVTKHSLVPKHIRVSKVGHKNIDKYPIIRRSDPVCRFYGFLYGDIIKIIRNDNTVYFRIVK